jgi:hypothetical protein
VIWKALGEYADLAGNSVVVFLVGKIPIKTCGDVSKVDVCFKTGHVHPIGFLGEHLNHQLLNLLHPFAHLHVQVDDRADILNDVFCLPSSS